MANPPVIENPSWAKDDAPEKAIPRYLKKYRNASCDEERAIALGNLVFVAQRMLKIAGARNAAQELVDIYVIPNLGVTKSTPKTLFCNWNSMVLDCSNIYKDLGSRAAEKQCLDLLYRESERKEDREFAAYLLAYYHAGGGDYESAIKTISLVSEDSKLGPSKKFLLSKWSRKKALADHENAVSKPAKTDKSTKIIP